MGKLFNLARMSSTTTGTGSTIALDGGAVTGCLTFAQSGVSNGDVIDYAIKDGNNSEIGTATYSSTGPQLTGRTVTNSTNSNAAINLSGAAEVFISPRAQTLNDAALIKTGTLDPARWGTGTADATTFARGDSTFSPPVGSMVAKAWVRYNASGTIAASFNVSSVSRSGTGAYTVNFATAFADSNYAWVWGFNARSAVASCFTPQIMDTTPSTSSFAYAQVGTPNGTSFIQPSDFPWASLVFFR